jgi:hypothetical protein
MNQPKKRALKNQPVKDEKEQITIAKIGVISAVAVAIIGLIGTIAAAYFSSQAAQAPVLIPIQATQTAEARNVPSMVKASQVPTETADVPAEDAWMGIFELRAWKGSCFEPAIIPSSIDMHGEPSLAFKQILQAMDNGDIEEWLSAPEKGNIITIYRSVVSKPGNLEWIQLGNKVDVTVLTRKDSPEHVDVVGECAGDGEYRDFPSIPLEARYDKYESNTTFSKVDFFTLQPGEFENLLLSFECSTPGTYTVEVTIPYMYMGRNGRISFIPKDFVCPQSYSVWTTLEKIPRQLSNYTWNGSGYEEAP